MQGLHGLYGLYGRTALVTRGNSGIGQAVVVEADVADANQRDRGDC